MPLSQMLSTQLLQEIPIHVPCGWILPNFEETSEESPAWKSSWRRMEIKVCCFHWNWNWAPLGFFDLITLNPWLPFLHLRTKLPMLTLTLQVDPRLPHCKFLDHLPYPLPLPHHPTCSHCWLAPRLVSFPFASWHFSTPWYHPSFEAIPCYLSFRGGQLDIYTYIGNSSRPTRDFCKRYLATSITDVAPHRFQKTIYFPKS